MYKCPAHPEPLFFLRFHPIRFHALGGSTDLTRDRGPLAKRVSRASF